MWPNSVLCHGRPRWLLRKDPSWIGLVLGAIPKLFYVNNSSEYWNRAASLISTDPAGLRDLEPAGEARIYLIASAQHYVDNQRDRGIFANCVNTLNPYRVMLALMPAFDR
jgi:hypothetical protein